MRTTQPFGLDGLGFITPMFWGGGEDGDGSDMTGEAPPRRRSFIADRSSNQSGQNLREMAIEFADPEMLLIAREELEERLKALEIEDQEERLAAIQQLALLGEEIPEDEGVSKRHQSRRPPRQPKVLVDGQLLDDFLAGKPNGQPLSHRTLRLLFASERSGGHHGRRRRRRGRRGNGRRQ